MLNGITEKNRLRIAWIDILKALGILAIFCGHMGDGTGHLNRFVFMYHVPLFFSLRGYLQES